MTKPKVLILDADEAHAETLATLFSTLGYSVRRSLERPLEEESANIIIADLDLPWAAPEVLKDPPFSEAEELVVMADDDDPALVRRCIAAGAGLFFRKPLSTDFLKSLGADLYRELAGSDEQLDGQVAPALDQFGRLRGRSRPMRRLFRVLRKVAPVDISVLMIGESGTGKELVAHTLHEMGKAPDAPFVAVNCAAIPHDLFESELFGHEKGSFTGAGRQHRGYFERAEGGTLFLDEVVEMPPLLQAKLLRVLEDGRYRRVGGEKDIPARVRIIAATNRQPEDAVEEGLLREDLYFRVARFPLHIPPLRERREDIVGLAHLFLLELNQRNESQISISEDAERALESYNWPGNVRELRSVIEHAFILAEDCIDAAQLPDLSNGLASDSMRIQAGQTVAEVERKLIFATLEATSGDREAAARMLGMSLRTLYNRLQRYRAEDDGAPGDGGAPDTV
jgi:DNA-binding NtrC family response regulator